MEQIFTAAVTGLAVLAGSALTARITSRVSKAEREERAKSELLAALVAYGAAIDRLDLKISQLPPQPGRVSRSSSALMTRLPTLDWLMGRLSTATLGRSTMKAVDELIYASNRLLLIAPESLFPPVESISNLLAGLEERDERWKADWQAAREDLAATSRRALHPEYV